MNIDLDSLQPDGSTGTTAAPTSDDLGITQTGAAGIEATYDQMTKRIFVIDKSGSMADRLLDLSSADDFDWRGAKLAERIENAQARMEAEAQGLLSALGMDEDEDEDEGEDDDEGFQDAGATNLVPHQLRSENPLNDMFWVGIASLPLEAQEAHIIAHPEAWRELGLKPKPEAEKRGWVSKMEACRNHCKRMVGERFAKNPDADVHLILFEGTTEYRKPKGLQDLLLQISAAQPDGGSTDIANALRRAVGLCKRSPSPVMTHQIILVTDGLDHGAVDAFELLKDMKELGIVLDFIHVSSPHESFSSEYVGAKLKRLCEETGGKFSRVARQSDFENRFVEASRRLCLPAPVKG